MHRAHSSRCSSTLAVSRRDRPLRTQAPSRSLRPAALLGGRGRRCASAGRPAAVPRAPGRPARRPSWRSSRAAARRRRASGPPPRGATGPAASARAGTRTPSRRRRPRTRRRPCRRTARRGRTASGRRWASASAGRADLVDVQAAYGGQQVGAERDVRAAAREQHVEHLDERLGHQVVGVRRGRRAGGPAGSRRRVPREQRRRRRPRRRRGPAR